MNMNIIFKFLLFIFLLLLTYIGDLYAIASSSNYYLTRGIAIALTLSTIGFLFFAKRKLKLSIYMFYFFLILNGLGLCYASSMILASFFI